MSVECDWTRRALPAIERPGDLAPAARAHLERCLRCQAEAAQYRRLRRALHELGARPAPSEPTVLAGILAALDAYDERLARRAATIGRAAVVVSGLVAATAGAAGAVVLARGRRQRVRLAG